MKRDATGAVGRRSPWVRALLGLVASVVALGAVWIAWAWKSRSGETRFDALVNASPFRNVGGGVEYVGDEACVRCHREIAESYRQHPMGRSVTPILLAIGDETGAAPAEASFEAQGYHYEVERLGDRLVHREQRLDDQGKVAAEVEAVIRYAVGSGERGYSFLVEREGFVNQSPISWYAQADHYDLAPSYQVQNVHFERVITPECLACHADGSHPAGEAVNRFETPLELRPIGCERCHGPGGLHVRQPGIRSEGFDPTIVNPAHLEPALRESVCQQCHLQGDDRVAARDRGAADFRPGLPLDEFINVYFDVEQLGRVKAVGQVEQMYASRCFEASGGKLGCISCHDPHHRPAPTDRVAHFRASCLACHESHGCALTESVRRGRQADDSCIACHMPRQGTADIPHVAMTDHRIPRLPESAPEATLEAEGDLPVVRFGPEGSAEPTGEGVEASRNVGLALFRYIQRHWDPNQSALLARRASERLDEAMEADPEDVEALETRANLLRARGRIREAREAFEAALKLAPRRETLLVAAALLAQASGQGGEAVALWTRAAEVNPYHADYPRRLAELHAGAGDWPEAARAARAALRLDISLLETRVLLVEALQHIGDREAARAELERLLAFDPLNAESLRRRFAEGP